MKQELEQLQQELKSFTKMMDDKIEKLMNVPMPHALPAYEIGKWYIAACGSMGGYLMRLNSIDKSDPFHPFKSNAYCYKNSIMYESGDFSKIERPATKGEIQEALITEAKRRGFKEGVKITRSEGMLDYAGEEIARSEVTLGELVDFEYYPKTDVLGFCDNDHFIYTLYHKGKWAEIIKDEEIKIGSYPVKFENLESFNPLMQTTKIDGHEFTKEFWQAAKTISEHPKASVFVGCGAKTSSVGGTNRWMVTLDQINAILNKLK